MAVSIEPPPGSGGLSPHGSPPSVVFDVTVPTSGIFVAYLSHRGGRMLIERGLLAGGTTKLRVFLPFPLPPGSTLHMSLTDTSGCYGDFVYPIG